MKRFTALLLCLVTLITATITVYADSIQPFSNNVNSTEVSFIISSSGNATVTCKSNITENPVLRKILKL